MAGLFRNRRKGTRDPIGPGDLPQPGRPAAPTPGAENAPPDVPVDPGVSTPDGSLEWVSTDVGAAPGSPGSVSSGTAATPNPTVERSDPTRAATEGVWEVIRPAAIVPEHAARRVLVELARRDLSNGGEWQSEPQLWSRFDGPLPEHGTTGPELMGTIHVTYGTPTKYEITLYRVTVTAAGVGDGWTVASLTDEALSFGGLSLAECPRATVNTPPRPYTY
jgi:hypothetical protein